MLTKRPFRIPAWLVAMRPRLDVYTLAAAALLVYAVALYARPASGIAGYIARDVGVNPQVLAALFAASSVLVGARRTPFALLWGTLPLAFYALAGVAAAIVYPTTYNLAGIGGQVGFWLMIHLAIRGQANAD
jgi:hypothetical protein